jgi:2-oxoacid:acceptor oxidoreductase delta subunit (pyruvate/2-ketoisovalerate family)
MSINNNHNHNHSDLNKGCVGSSSKNSKVRNTSGWRTFKPIFTERCRGCGVCIAYCPEGCIELHETTGGKKLAKVDYAYCKGCLLCMALCPFKAIDKELEKK